MNSDSVLIGLDGCPVEIDACGADCRLDVCCDGVGVVELTRV